MSKNKCGFSPDGKTMLFGDQSKGVGKIYIDRQGQFAPNEFIVALNRFGAVSEISNSDVQNTILNGVMTGKYIKI